VWVDNHGDDGAINRDGGRDTSDGCSDNDSRGNDRSGDGGGNDVDDVGDNGDDGGSGASVGRQWWLWHSLFWYTCLYNKIHENIELHKMRFCFLSIKKFMWVKGSHWLHYFQIKLINIFYSKQGHSSLQKKSS